MQIYASSCSYRVKKFYVCHNRFRSLVILPSLHSLLPMFPRTPVFLSFSSFFLLSSLPSLPSLLPLFPSLSPSRSPFPLSLFPSLPNFAMICFENGVISVCCLAFSDFLSFLWVLAEDGPNAWTAVTCCGRSERGSGLLASICHSHCSRLGNE